MAAVDTAAVALGKWTTAQTAEPATALVAKP
jgi:hypothetical protein